MQLISYLSAIWMWKILFFMVLCIRWSTWHLLGTMLLLSMFSVSVEIFMVSITLLVLGTTVLGKGSWRALRTLCHFFILHCTKRFSHSTLLPWFGDLLGPSQCYSLAAKMHLHHYWSRCSLIKSCWYSIWAKCQARVSWWWTCLWSHLLHAHC